MNADRGLFVPDFTTLDDAVEKARNLAHIMGEKYTIVAECSSGRLGFYAILMASYASLRERGVAYTMAPTATVHPDGRVDLYTPFKELTNMYDTRPAFPANLSPHVS